MEEETGEREERRSVEWGKIGPMKYSAPKQQPRVKMLPPWESAPRKKSAFQTGDDGINDLPDPKTRQRFVTVDLTNSISRFITFLCASVGLPKSAEPPSIMIL